jgi:plasmid stabilization system protein ParE
VNAGRVEYFPEAIREIEDAFDWYLERSPRAAEAFLHEVDRAIALIATSPQVWPFFEAGTKRYVLTKFPYSLIYREEIDRIRIVAVAHHKRRPLYWRSRLDS